MDQGSPAQGACRLTPTAEYDTEPVDVPLKGSRGRYNRVADDELFALGKLVAEYLHEVGVPPSLREIGEAINLKSVSGVRIRMWAAVDAGYLRAVSRGANHRFLPTAKTLEQMG